jgi:hypothetical protein
MAQSLLQASTVEITMILQKDIVVCLSDVVEASLRASSWFNDTWAGERCNYTNATGVPICHQVSSHTGGT